MLCSRNNYYANGKNMIFKCQRSLPHNVFQLTRTRKKLPFVSKSVTGLLDGLAGVGHSHVRDTEAN